MDELSPVFESVSRYFALLAEPMRVRVLHAICQREKTVNEIVAETGATQTNISRHLGLMHRAGVLSRRKDGNFVYYGVADTAITEICRSVCTHIAGRSDTTAPPQAELLALVRDLGPATPARRPAPRRARAPRAMTVGRR
jgi:DNA-binding transcriptional ArsR family regulator